MKISDSENAICFQQRIPVFLTPLQSVQNLAAANQHNLLDSRHQG